MLSRTDADDIDAKYYITLASFVVLSYDYALTFEMEMARFWSSPQHNWGRGIFLLNRYLSLIGHIPVVAEMFLHDPTEKVCTGMQAYHEWLAIIIQVIVAAIMITRTYALWGCSRRILTSLIVLAAAVIAFGGWSLFAGKSNHPISGLYPGIVGCQLGLSSDQSHHLGAAWAGLVLSDTTIFMLTVYKSLTFDRMGHRSIVDVLLRDGAMYFAVIGTMALLNVFSFMFGRPFSRGILTTTTNMHFSSVAATRLMLNIRSHDEDLRLNGLLAISTATRHTNIRFTHVTADSESSFPAEQLIDENEVEEPMQSGAAGGGASGDDFELSPFKHLISR